MTNEEKALDIIFGWADDVQECAKDATMEMAQWKDQQFKEYLMKKYKAAQDAYMKSTDQSEDYTCGRADVLVDIINELFKEE